MIAIKNKNELKSPRDIQLTYGDGRININSNGGYIAGIQIKFNGAINSIFNKDLQDNTLCETGESGIVIINLTEYIIQGDILHYKGYLNIDSVIVSDKNAKQIACNVVFLNAQNKPENLNSNPEDLDIEPQNMNKGYFYGKYRTKNKNTILAKQGKKRRVTKSSSAAQDSTKSSNDTY